MVSKIARFITHAMDVTMTRHKLLPDFLIRKAIFEIFKTIETPVKSLSITFCH